MSSSYIEYLRHILDECHYIESTMQSVNSFASFVSNEDKKRGVVRSLEIIGEAAKKVPGDIKLKWNNIEWKAIAGMRDKLIHDYAEVDYSVVWNVITHKITPLKAEIEKILNAN